MDAIAIVDVYKLEFEYWRLRVLEIAHDVFTIPSTMGYHIRYPISHVMHCRTSHVIKYRIR
jgi:hypothetical protein